jgi:P4 family phage/plasmid primase-like protien
MTDKINNKKLLKYKEKVYEFLNKFRCNDDNKDKATHLSYGSFSGKFILDKDQRKDFMTQYSTAIENGVNDFAILEMQKEYAPLIIDIDLEIPSEDYKGGRLYDNKMVLYLSEKYIKSLNNYLDVSKVDYRICLLEKKNPVEKEGVYKDGFHLMIQELFVPKQIRHLIRHNVVKNCEDDGIFANFSNAPDKIIDKAVVSTNAWFLYGSKKPNGQLYQLSKLYDKKLNIIYDHEKKLSFDNETFEESEHEESNTDLINFLSIQKQKYSKKYATPLLENCDTSEIDAECDKFGINSAMKAEKVKYDVPVAKEDDVRRATKFTDMLSDKRASDYHDWLNVGLALHYIDESLLLVWIDFSKKCGRKYKEGECEKNWNNMKNPQNGKVLTVRSLAYWAKQDDPKEYEAFIHEEFRLMMKKSLNGETYHLAKSVHSKYSDRFVCSAYKSNIWWEFKNHRWHRIEEGYSLKVLLSEDFANEYNREIAELSLKATHVSGFEKEELQNKRSRIDKIVDRLMDNSFKNKLMDECKALFYDTNFEQKLDSNTKLIGFENGIYDLEQNIFREGRPDDYITLSTKNDYYKWNERNPFNPHLFKFFDQVLPNKAVRDYFLNALCTCLTGDTKEEKMYIMTGSGSNGKSLTMDLMYLALGEYYMSCPITIITRKRGQSNETSPEKVRMKGRRCGVFQETDDGEKLNVGVMKEFTGGDKVLVRDLFKGSADMIEFKPQMKYFLTCNQLPAVPSNDDGTWRRLRVIQFGSKFTDNPTKQNEFMIDNTLKQKIEQWAPNFISYLIHIYNTEYKSKKYLTEPEEVMAFTNQYKMENDFYTEFITEKIVITNNSNDTIGRDNLWEEFKDWYKKTYDSKNVPKKMDFNKFMAKQFGEPAKGCGYANVSYLSDNDNKVVKSDLDV